MTHPPESIKKVHDGPEYSPNKFRRVVVLRDDDTPSFKRCLDVDTGEVLSIHVNKLEDR